MDGLNYVRADPLQAMYKKWKPLGKKQEPPLPMGSNGDVDDDAEDDDDDDDDWAPPEFLVAPADIRPWAPFSDASVWPQLDIDELRVGVPHNCFSKASPASNLPGGPQLQITPHSCV